MKTKDDTTSTLADDDSVEGQDQTQGQEQDDAQQSGENISDQIKKAMQEVMQEAAADSSQDEDLDDDEPDAVAEFKKEVTAKAKAEAIEAVKAVTAFHKAARTQAQKELADLDIDPNMIEDALTVITDQWTDPTTLNEILKSGRFMQVIHAKIGELAVRGQLKKKAKPEIPEQTPVNGQNSSTVDQQIAQFRAVFNSEPSKALKNVWAKGAKV